MLILLFREHSLSREWGRQQLFRPRSTRDSCQGVCLSHIISCTLSVLSTGALRPSTTWVQLKGGSVSALSPELGSAGSHWMDVLICDYAHLFLLCCKRRGKHKPRLIVYIPPGCRLRKASSHTLVPLIPACPGSRGREAAAGCEHISAVTRGAESPTPLVTSSRHGRLYSPVILPSVFHRLCCAGSAAVECFHSSALQ